MAPKKKPAKAVAKKPAAKASKASKPAAKAASKPVAMAKAKPAQGSKAPKAVTCSLNGFLAYAEKNPMPTLAGIIAVALGLMLIFS